MRVTATDRSGNTGTCDIEVITTDADDPDPNYINAAIPMGPTTFHGPPVVDNAAPTNTTTTTDSVMKCMTLSSCLRPRQCARGRLNCRHGRNAQGSIEKLTSASPRDSGLMASRAVGAAPFACDLFWSGAAQSAENGRGLPYRGGPSVYVDGHCRYGRFLAIAEIRSAHRWSVILISVPLGRAAHPLETRNVS
jgi:hypothetical protein